MKEAFESLVAQDIARRIDKDLEELEDEEKWQYIDQVKNCFLDSDFKEIKNTEAGEWLFRSVTNFSENELSNEDVNEVCRRFWQHWDPDNDDFDLEIESFVPVKEEFVPVKKKKEKKDENQDR